MLFKCKRSKQQAFILLYTNYLNMKIYSCFECKSKYYKNQYIFYLHADKLYIHLYYVLILCKYLRIYLLGYNIHPLSQMKHYFRCMRYLYSGIPNKQIDHLDK